MPRHWRRRSRDGQTLVEFSLLAPLLVLMMFLLIDFGRLVYTFGAIAWATREGARLISLEPQQATDCLVLQRVEAVGRGFPLTPDPNSIRGNTDPNNPSGTLVPSTPPDGTGYIYIWPAVAPRTPQDTNCNGNPRLGSSTARDVAVQIQYAYVPMVPLIKDFVPRMIIRTISVVHTEY